MAIKLAVLKSGEDVIADVKELILRDRIVGYTFINPATVRFLNPESIYFPEENIDIVFAPWIPLTSQKEVPVAPDWIITLVDPIPQVIEKYKEGVNNGRSQSSDSDERAEIDKSSSGNGFGVGRTGL
jgi:hypothetical protein